VCDALNVPACSHAELEPSPHENLYCTGLPSLETAPPVEYVELAPVTTFGGPVGVSGAETPPPIRMFQTSDGSDVNCVWVRHLAIT
jgi:hypothetical protein